jgi:hypothetical protein
MDKRSCRECGADVLILPCADLGGRRVAFEVFKVPVASLPGLRQAWAYLRHRGVVRLAGRARVPDRALLRPERLGTTRSRRRRLVLTGPPEGMPVRVMGGTAAREGTW